MEEEVLISIMATLIVLASFISIILMKLRLPSLVGFLIAGIVIANYMELPEGSEDVISIFSNLGLIMLMFAIGMEIDLSKMKVQGRFAIFIAIIQIPVMLFVGIIAGSAMGLDSVQAITFGAILSGASTAVVLAVLKSNNVLDQDKMDILILVMIIEDISQVIMISVLTPMMKGDDMSTDSLLVLILSIALFMIVCSTLGLKIIPRIIDWVYERSNDELISLFCMGILFVFALLANQVGLSVAIGAFLTGVMVGMSRPKHVVEHFIDPLKTLFMAMFFISVGMEVSVTSLSENIPMIITIYVLFAVFMFLAVNIGYWVANGDSRSGWISAMAMCTMGEFAFIISKQALDYGVYDQSFYSSIIGAAIVSMLFLPVLVGTSEKTFGIMDKICPRPVKSVTGAMTNERDLLYHGLSVASRRSKERFSKALTNSAFLIILVVIIETAFFFMYDPLSGWFAANIGLDQYAWRIIILFANIVALLIPCWRLARFLRFTLYFINKGRTFTDGADEESRALRLFENYSALAVGAAITVAIVLVVPNGISDYVHILILLLVLMMILVYQAYKYRNAAPAEDVTQSVPEGSVAETTATEGPSAVAKDDVAEGNASSEDNL